MAAGRRKAKKKDKADKRLHPEPLHLGSLPEPEALADPEPLHPEPLHLEHMDDEDVDEDEDADSS